jgi:hypothetical protein
LGTASTSAIAPFPSVADATPFGCQVKSSLRLLETGSSYSCRVL